jgi:hypothetical protein
VSGRYTKSGRRRRCCHCVTQTDESATECGTSPEPKTAPRSIPPNPAQVRYHSAIKIMSVYKLPGLSSVLSSACPADLPIRARLPLITLCLCHRRL